MQRLKDPNAWIDGTFCACMDDTWTRTLSIAPDAARLGEAGEPELEIGSRGGYWEAIVLDEIVHGLCVHGSSSPNSSRPKLSKESIILEPLGPDLDQ